MSESRNRLRVILDANLLVSAVMTRSGVPNQVIRAWQAGKFLVITSKDTVNEVAAVLTRERIRIRYRVAHAEATELISRLATSLSEPMPLNELPIRCRDPKDDIVLACALGCQAGYIVSGDDDLLSLDGEPALGALRVVTPRRFLEILDEQAVKTNQ